MPRKTHLLKKKKKEEKKSSQNLHEKDPDGQSEMKRKRTAQPHRPTCGTATWVRRAANTASIPPAVIGRISIMAMDRGIYMSIEKFVEIK